MVLTHCRQSRRKENRFSTHMATLGFNPGAGRLFSASISLLLNNLSFVSSANSTVLRRRNGLSAILVNDSSIHITSTFDPTLSSPRIWSTWSTWTAASSSISEAFFNWTNRVPKPNFYNSQALQQQRPHHSRIKPDFLRQRDTKPIVSSHLPPLSFDFRHGRNAFQSPNNHPCAMRIRNRGNHHIRHESADELQLHELECVSVSVQTKNRLWMCSAWGEKVLLHQTLIREWFWSREPLIVLSWTGFGALAK